MVEFSDGTLLDTSGEIRKEQIENDWFVVGNGILIPCQTESECELILEQMAKILVKKENLN